MPENLQNQEVLLIDCQATHADPSRGSLLEIGWQRFRSRDVEGRCGQPPSVLLLRLPDSAVLPRRVTAVTGLDRTALAAGVEPAAAWQALAADARRIAKHNGLDQCPAVIHFARYERAHLKALHAAGGDRRPFPLAITCTHAITRRLYPDLPRKGLRAVAGYFGHGTPEKRRCAAHLEATALVWHHLVRRLETRMGIQTLADLHRWLERRRQPGATTTAGRGKHRYPMERSTRLALPDTPGIYCMQRSNGDRLYIGKATSLRKRVNSYFQKRRQHSEKILEMLTQAKQIETTTTGTALEAALLESEEIKRVDPPYNQALRADNRALFFWSRDFSAASTIKTVICPMGPLPSAPLFHAVGLIGDCIRPQPPATDELATHRLLAVPPDHAPEKKMLVAGIAAFRGQHGGQHSAATARRTLQRIGRLAWQARQQAAVQEKEPTPEKDPAAKKEFQWSPAAVAAAMGSLLGRSGHLLRRSRWTALLCDATVAWQNRPPHGDAMTILFLYGGAVRNRRDFSRSAPIPPHPCSGSNSLRPLRVRSAGIDLVVYDRLRVLTTEIRRLLAEGRWVQVQPMGLPVLTASRLARLLWWV